MKKSLKYVISLLVGAGLIFGIAYSKDIFAQTEVVKIYHILCDSFFSVGVLMACVGLLIFTANEGVFDGFTYVVGAFFNMFRKERDKKYHTYYDYKDSKERGNSSFVFLLICGLFYVIVGLVFLWLYHS